ncbi:hypothetical protein MJ_1639 [Methanocaldococcus jannaschii DSM 2661]|uniref:Uncharacterized protein MJ1639 n=1 Tax=Methanocaldococcus jannaschii (strain ATCC 43067 / DSM 2661 / JAL-1 / JCM 10045 / NBRC 100440) TaxID=243232 RepID=Y1639_METJA|nr:RecName: Full=Uncharacterized protein MJ1639 [Methanocaldococcus jannaschii DSM 2661]AAB99665.1 hypothetical protein MJ_1639 [Methanocaldococcus jannaschii DSM 2661]
MYFVIKGDSIMYFVLRLGGDLSLYIPAKYRPFFEPLDKNSPYNIKVNLENSSGDIVVDNVLDDKKIDERNSEITKLGGLINELRRKKENGDNINIIEIRLKLKDDSIITHNLNTPNIEDYDDNKLVINSGTLVINGKTTIDLNNIEEITLKLDI